MQPRLALVLLPFCLSKARVINVCQQTQCDLKKKEKIGIYTSLDNQSLHLKFLSRRSHQGTVNKALFLAEESTVPVAVRVSAQVPAFRHFAVLSTKGTCGPQLQGICSLVEIRHHVSDK